MYTAEKDAASLWRAELLIVSGLRSFDTCYAACCVYAGGLAGCECLVLVAAGAQGCGRCNWNLPALRHARIARCSNPPSAAELIAVPGARVDVSGCYGDGGCQAQKLAGLGSGAWSRGRRETWDNGTSAPGGVAAAGPSRVCTRATKHTVQPYRSQDGEGGAVQLRAQGGWVPTLSRSSSLELRRSQDCCVCSPFSLDGVVL